MHSELRKSLPHTLGTLIGNAKLLRRDYLQSQETLKAGSGRLFIFADPANPLAPWFCGLLQGQDTNQFNRQPQLVSVHIWSGRQQRVTLNAETFLTLVTPLLNNPDQVSLAVCGSVPELEIVAEAMVSQHPDISTEVQTCVAHRLGFDPKLFPSLPFDPFDL